jgi:hydroxymethylbilane synthase
VIALLGERLGVDAEPVVIRTEGDVDKTSPLTVIGGRGVFTSALEAALLRGEIEAAVHSAKDLPSERPAGLALAAFPEREDARDVLVSRHGLGLEHLPPRPRIGTSSRRRAMQVRLRRPDAVVVELRGNVDSRLRKALATDVDAIVLAAAGVRRMGWHDRVTEELPLDAFVPSPGQGALAVEVRADDPLAETLAALDDPAVARAVRAERAFLRAVGGGCTAPIGAHVAGDGGGLRLLAMLGSDDGRRVVWADEPMPPTGTEEAAIEVALRMLSDLRAGRGGCLDAAPTFVAAAQPVPPPRGPLTGVSVLITRPRAQAAPLAAALAERGAKPVVLPAIRIEDPSDPDPLIDAVARAGQGGYDWVVFTSANAVARTLGVADRLGVGPGALARVGVAAVGRATAAALAAEGIRVGVVAERSSGEGLVEALAGHRLAGARVLYPKADGARDVVPDGLRALGANVEAVEAYRTVAETEADPALVAAVGRGGVEVAIFASPSAVHGLKRLLGLAWSGLDCADIVCVGPVTAAAARDVGLRVDVVAGDPTVAGVIEALVRHRTEPAMARGRNGDGGAEDGTLVLAGAASPARQGGGTT